MTCALLPLFLHNAGRNVHQSIDPHLRGGTPKYTNTGIRFTSSYFINLPIAHQRPSNVTAGISTLYISSKKKVYREIYKNKTKKKNIPVSVKHLVERKH